MTFIPASFMKLFIRYREELKRSVNAVDNFQVFLRLFGMCRKTRVRTPNGCVSDGTETA